VIFLRLYSSEINIKTIKELEMVNISSQVQQIVLNSKQKNGIVNIFVQGSTAALTTIEFEPGLQKDFPRFLEKIIPSNIEYEHHLTWHDNNGHSHVRAALLKPDLTIPFKNSKLCTGTWQQIVLIELDTRPRNRTIFVQVIGE
jgi:secondary thiamine-phosphate synthase enzyme